MLNSKLISKVYIRIITKQTLQNWCPAPQTSEAYYEKKIDLSTTTLTFSILFLSSLLHNPTHFMFSPLIFLKLEVLATSLFQ